MSYTKLYLYVPTPEVSKKVQKILFSLGIKWVMGSQHFENLNAPHLVIKNDVIYCNTEFKNARRNVSEGHELIDCSWMENIED